MAHRRKIRIRGISPARRKKHRKCRRKAQTSLLCDCNPKQGSAKRLYTDVRKYRVEIIESLPDEEIQTGTKLYEGDLKPLTLQDDSLVAYLHKVSTISEFTLAIDSIISSLQDDELVTLHIEAHGDGENGIRLSSGEILGWKVFMDLCRRLNEELLGMLVVTTAVCYSFSIIGSFDPTKRAPFKAIMLTNKDVKVDEIERGYSAFYQKYRNVLDVFKATGAIQAEVNQGEKSSSPFHLMVADNIFDEFVNPDRDPCFFTHLVNENFCRLKAQNPEYTRERVENELREFFCDLAKNGREYFTFQDVIKGK